MTEEEVLLEIKRLGINGEGIGFYRRLAVFVEDAIPKEVHRIHLIPTSEKMIVTESLERVKTSPMRINASCPYYHHCGGCNTAHIRYEAMLEWKRDILIECLARYTTLRYRQFEIRKTIPSVLPIGYRNRSQLGVRKKESGRLTCFMLKKNSNLPVDIDTCLVQHPKLNEVNQKILKLADELQISPYVSKLQKGILRYLILRMNAKEQVLVCLVCGEKSPKISLLAEKVSHIPGVVGVYESWNPSKKRDEFFGEEMHLLYGDPYVVEKIGKISYRLYPDTFFQLNTAQAQVMYDVILKACKLSRKEVVLDAYCGVGSIGLYLASMAKEVIGIEYHSSSVEAANQNKEINHIRNAKFLQGDVVSLLPKMIKEGKKFDVIVFDPPRTGLGKELIQTVLSAKIPRLVYASCNPATLAKDLELLSKEYQVKYITPIDMFPQTALVEAVCSLVLKKEDQ